MIKILAFDTSLDLCSVAISVDAEIIGRQESARQNHNRLLLPMIENLLRQANLQLKDLDVIAFGCGPGSFTGIRLATSIAQGLAFGANLPVLPLSSLQILAQTVYDKYGHQQVLTALDARMQQIYWGAYVEKNGLMTAVIPDAILVPTKVSCPYSGDWVGAGDGWQAFKDELCAILPVKTIIYEQPEARSMIGLARFLYESKKAVMPKDAVPIYLGKWQKL